MHRRIAPVLMLALLTSSCGGGDGIEIDRAWARPSPQMTTAGAVYMDITSPDGDRLIGASVAPSIATRAEIHESAMADDGTMRMQEVGEIALPEGETVSLEPGGLHIMLVELAEPLVPGDTFDVVLDFAGGGSITVAVTVGDEAP